MGLFSIFKSKSKLSDDELIILFRESNDNELVGELFNRYIHLVYGVCIKYLRNKEDSKDAVMQIFEKLMQELNNNEVKNFKSWLYTITKNYCLNHLVNKARQNTKEEKYNNNHIFSEYEGDIEKAFSYENRMEQLEKALEKLEDEQRLCVQLFYLQNKSYREITSMTGYSANQVKSFIQNGKRNLKIILSKSNEAIL